MAAALATATAQSTAASRIAGRIELMRTSPLFHGLSKEAYEDLAISARAKTINRDDYLFMQGEPARELMLIRSGSIKITQVASNGNEVLLWMYGAGTVVGEVSELASPSHSCSVRAMEPTSALVWERGSFQRSMARHPQIGSNQNLILASRLNELEERFREVATEQVSTRIALALLRLLKHTGRKVLGGVEVSLTREELAQMTGTTLFTTSRVLSQWSKKGFVSPLREGVLVRDPHRLEMAGEGDVESETLLARGKRQVARLQPAPLGMLGMALMPGRSGLAGEAAC
jgi:CRP-like cAMP-binding protein